MTTHASLPVAEFLNPEVLRIYFGTRDSRGKSHIGFVDVEAANPAKILGISEEPVLPLGKLGTFDDSGIMPSWIVNNGGARHLYYIGWNPQVTVSYRLAIGLAVSVQGTNVFTKYAEGPIADRSIEEPFFNTAPCVLVEDGLWRMWYISCTGWEVIDGHPEPNYHVKYAESTDGIRWNRTGRVCIDYDPFAAAIGRPCVFRVPSGYAMLYSYRNTKGYRTSRSQGYRLGYALSADGLIWERRDSEVGIARSERGWDSEMMEYCFIYDYKGTKVMLYNGNGFGKTGFGYAVLD